MRRARANHGRQAAVAAAMVAAAIDAAMADNAAAVNRLNPLIIFVKPVAPATAFLFHQSCAATPDKKSFAGQSREKKTCEIAQAIDLQTDKSQTAPKIDIACQKKATSLNCQSGKWAGLDSNQRRRKASRFTVCPVWPLRYLPSRVLI